MLILITCTPQLHWSSSDNTLSWTQSVHDFQELKASQPTLKFHVSPSRDGNTSQERSKEKDYGFFLLDVRNIRHEEQGETHLEQQWQGSQSHSQELQRELKVNQLHGATVRISAVLLTPSHGHTIRDSQDSGGIHRSGVDVHASNTSLNSVIALPARYDRDAHPGSLRRYTLSLSIVASRHLQQMVRQLRSNDPRQQLPSLWFSWSILDITLQSAEFDPSSPQGLEAATDSLFFECSEVALLNLLEEIGMVRVFLCAPGCILGVAELPLPRQLNRLPFQKQGWFPVKSIEDNNDGGQGQDQPAVHLGFEVTDTAVEEAPNVIPMKGAVKSSEGEQVRKNDEVNDDEYSDDGYEDDSFQLEDGDEDGGVRHSTQSHPLLLLKGQQARVRAQDGGDSSVSASIGTSTASPEEQVQQLEADEQATALERDEFEERRVRLCLQVKTLRPLHRPVRASVQFSYPHLGVGTAVRTHTAWTEANVETVVDGGTACFDCTMTKHRLKDIFDKELFVVQVLSRSHLGVSKFGDASVSLNKLYAQAPHSYICPVTQKAFKTLALYRQHRQLMIALHSAGKVEHVPAFYPITLKTVDTYLPVLHAATGNKSVETVGKVRVLLTLEDFGPASLGGSISDMRVQNHSRQSSRQAQGTPIDDSDGCRGEGEEREHAHAQEEWERWRRAEEDKWSAALREKERLLRQRLEAEAADNLSQRADDLRRAQEEVGRLEVRLRSSIDLVERQKAQLELKEEQMSARLAQKTSELELLQRRVREEAKAKIEAETRRAVTLQAEVNMLQEQVGRTTKRAEDAEKDYEIYKNHVRSMPETSLREETSRLKAQLGELRTEIERERRLRGETELEKEHYRTQMHRIAVALKREREKSSAVARQELEQLRLEFLSREERYVLDGDRDELRTIRKELSGLRNLEAANLQYMNNHRNQQQQEHRGPSSHTLTVPVEKIQLRHSFEIGGQTESSSSSGGDGGSSTQLDKLNRVTELRRELLASELYSPGDPVIVELDRTIKQAEVHLAEGKIFGGTAEVK